jgi:hypothetical protein
MKVYWMLGMVWDGLNDNRAADLWQKARALLQSRSEKIADDKQRKLFLKQAPARSTVLNAK